LLFWHISGIKIVPTETFLKNKKDFATKK